MATDALTLSAPIASSATGPVTSARGVRPVAVLQVAITAMLIGNIGRIPIFSGTREAPLLFNEIALAAVLGIGAIACLQARALRLDRVAFLALAFAAIGALSALLGMSKFGLTPIQVTFALAYLARWLAYFGIYVVVLNTATSRDVPALWRTYERMVIAFALFGIVQSIFVPGFAQLVFPEETSSVIWDKQGHRLVSTLLDPNFAGAFVLVPLLVLLARLSFGERIARWKLLVLFAAVLMTVSRSSILALVAGLAVIALVRGIERRLARVLACCVLALVPFLPTLARFASSFDKLRVDDSAMLRFISWTRAITVFLDNPWLGVGFNTYGFIQTAYGFEAATKQSGSALDGGLLFIAVMTGLVGISLYGWMIVAVVRRCRGLWRDVRQPPMARGIGLGTAAATIAILVHSIFVNSMLLPFVLEVTWLLWGMVFLYAAAARRSGVRS